MRKLTFEVEPGLGRIRLDDYLFARLGSLSRMYLRELVKTDRVQINGEFTNVGVRLRSGDFIEVEADISRGTSMQPEDIALDIVFEDSAIVVVNKPAGMLVHPTHRDKNGTLLNALTFYLNQKSLPHSRKEAKEGILPQSRVALEKTDGPVRPGLVHRLDRETSGLIVVAKTLEAHRRLAREFMKKGVKKIYLALVEGTVADDEGTISVPIGRHAEKKRWDIKHDGKVSLTRFRVMQTSDDSTLLELEPVTGRTNQLRIHCASIGHPIVGDMQRGGREFSRVCLHAYHISFKHPFSVGQIEIRTAPPTFAQGL